MTAASGRTLSLPETSSNGICLSQRGGTELPDKVVNSQAHLVKNTTQACEASAEFYINSHLVNEPADLSDAAQGEGDDGRGPSACEPGANGVLGPSTPEQMDIVGTANRLGSDQSSSPSVDGPMPGAVAPVEQLPQGAGWHKAPAAQKAEPPAQPAITAAAATNVALAASCAVLPDQQTEEAPELATAEAASASSADNSEDPPLVVAAASKLEAGAGETAASAGDAADTVPVTPTTPLRAPGDAPLLPPATDPQRMTLVLDLDGTLIASEDEPHAPVPFDYCVDDERFVWLRPGLRRFLDAVRPLFEVVLFTAAGESWATCAMQRIDPKGTIFDSKLYRDHTVFHDDWPWVKDLSRLGRDLSRVLIVDDNPLMFMYQPDNALHVAAYDPQIAGHQDDVLEQVLDVLIHKVLPADDVREVLRGIKEPITASCVAARQAAARAIASSVASAKAGGAAPGAARKAPGGSGATAVGAGAAAAAASGKAAGWSPQAAGGSDTAASTPATVPVASSGLAPPVAPGSVVQGKSGRRARRPPKSPLSNTQPQPAQQQQQQQPVGPQDVLQAAAAALAAPHAQQRQRQPSDGASSAGAQQPPQQQPQGARRQQRRRRGSGAGTAAGKPGDAGTAGAPTAQAGQPQPGQLRPSVGPGLPRPPTIVSRSSLGQKQVAPTHAALQQAAASALQQPEQQLQLKLKLLQLQREQEEEEPEEEQGQGQRQELGVEGEARPSGGGPNLAAGTTGSSVGAAASAECHVDGAAGPSDPHWPSCSGSRGGPASAPAGCALGGSVADGQAQGSGPPGPAAAVAAPSAAAASTSSSSSNSSGGSAAADGEGGAPGDSVGAASGAAATVPMEGASGPAGSDAADAGGPGSRSRSRRRRRGRRSGAAQGGEFAGAGLADKQAVSGHAGSAAGQADTAVEGAALNM